MENKKDILWRVYLLYFLFCLFGVVILSKVFLIQFVEGKKWREKAESLTTAVRNIEAVRGNIYAADGSLLATSVPYYETRIDLKADAITDKIFNESIDSLAYCLSRLFNDKSAKAYKKDLQEGRKRGDRYHLIKRGVKYDELKQMRAFPLLRKGRYKGGFIYVQQNKRQKPFRSLAARTIGYDVKGVKSVGLEGAYNADLQGVEGKRLMQKIAGGVWMPINDDNEIEPEDGCEIYTTIDINIQDVAEHALYTQLEKHDADHGCVVLMEVSTGDVKAISNLQRDSKGNYFEYYNYAIGESTEPGSTFKLASLMVAFEDGFVDLKDSVNAEQGEVRFYDATMRDTKKGGYGKITVQRAFEVSSNIGVAKVVTNHYSKNPQKFIDRLYKMNLHQPLGLQIAGEGKPQIKDTKDKSWSGISLPWISHGYEVSMTPLQILTFYNAVANNGKMVRPKFVSEVRNKRKIVKKVETKVINEAICSQETIEKAKKMLEGVVENGTATNLKNKDYKIAGKTGTAQIANAKYGYKYDSHISYQASFVGYFPADNPKYSCIVVVNAPSNNVYYGNLVAGPIFKEVADKVYSTSIEIHESLEEKNLAIQSYPYSKSGNKSELKEVFDELKLHTIDKANDVDWVTTRAKDKFVQLEPRTIVENLMPNVAGMSVDDAVFLLENAGLRVRFTGKGSVKSQSIPSGIRIEKGTNVMLELS